jgi:hypothetical protein
MRSVGVWQPRLTTVLPAAPRSLCCATHAQPKVPINRIPAAWRKAAAAGPQGESVPAATEESQV